MPLVRVSVLAVPEVRSKVSANCQVPPTPSKVMGLSMIFPALVMVLVPEVAPNVMAVALPAGIVMPETSVRLPLMVLGKVGPVPVNPVKSRLVTLVTLVKVMVLVPAEIQILPKPEAEPASMVLLVAELSVVLIVAFVVPPKVRLVEVVLVQTVPVPETAMVPGPWMSLVLELEVEKSWAVSVWAVLPES